MIAGAEDQDCGAGHPEANGGDACPFLRLVCASCGKFRQHRAADCERKQGGPGDHRLAATAEDEQVENKAKAETNRD